MKNVLKFFSLVSVLLISIFAGCQQDVSSPVDSQPPAAVNQIATLNKPGVKENGWQELPFRTRMQLLEAKQATAKYRNINNAVKDGYADINVFIHNMGFHYMKSAYLDDKFEPGRPELLVYSPSPENGKMRLVAVEYAVPQSLSPSAPEGFYGDADVWDKNDDFGLWTLHAWIWYNNPAGVFSEYNQLIP